MSDNAQLIASNVPGSVSPGQPFQFSLTFKNIGDTEWVTTNPPVAGDYRLSSINPDDNSVWGQLRYDLPSTPISPSEQAAFTVDATAPSVPGTYSFSWRMVQEGVARFGDAYNGSFGAYRRFGVEGDGTVHWYGLSSGSPTPADILHSDLNGNLVFGNSTIATNATNGFFYLECCAGTPTGTPTGFSGRAPMVVDTTAGKLWIYYSGAWHFTALT